MVLYGFLVRSNIIWTSNDFRDKIVLYFKLFNPTFMDLCIFWAQIYFLFTLSFWSVNIFGWKFFELYFWILSVFRNASSSWNWIKKFQIVMHLLSIASKCNTYLQLCTDYLIHVIWYFLHNMCHLILVTCDMLPHSCYLILITLYLYILVLWN